MENEQVTTARAILRIEELRMEQKEKAIYDNNDYKKLLQVWAEIDRVCNECLEEIK